MKNFLRGLCSGGDGRSSRRKVDVFLAQHSDAREHSVISSVARQPSWESLRASLDAEVALANQEVATDFLNLWQTETCPILQKHFADQYRRMVGVDPAHHDELKQALESIRDAGGMRVTDLVATFNRRDQLNGSLGTAADSSAGT